ncbi:hypothetical protein PENTCL1PPCAC_28278, partial [Pristionchus entomophagus]
MTDTPGKKSSISGVVTMKFALLLLLVPLVIDSVEERSHRNALLTFDEWDLNQDCFVTYREFVNYFLDMLFAIRQYEANVSALENKTPYLREEDFDIAAEEYYTNVNSLDPRKTDVNVVIKLLLHSPISSLKTVFKIDSIINSTFWHRP